VLEHSNVETFITFRSSTPVILSLCDYLFLGRELPSPRSWVALLLLVASSAGYAFFDQGFVVTAYFWLAVWYFFFTWDCVYNKRERPPAGRQGLPRFPRHQARL
jgi:solute carrier family 35 protein